jgi:hypothetical protein
VDTERLMARAAVQAPSGTVYAWLSITSPGRHVIDILAFRHHSCRDYLQIASHHVTFIPGLSVDSIAYRHIVPGFARGMYPTDWTQGMLHVAFCIMLQVACCRCMLHQMPQLKRAPKGSVFPTQHRAPHRTVSTTLSTVGL